MVCHLYADVIEEEGAGKAGQKKKGGSMQTISATHRVSYFCSFDNARSVEMRLHCRKRSLSHLCSILKSTTTKSHQLEY